MAFQQKNKFIFDFAPPQIIDGETLGVNSVVLYNGTMFGIGFKVNIFHPRHHFSFTATMLFGRLAFLESFRFKKNKIYNV